MTLKKTWMCLLSSAEHFDDMMMIEKCSDGCGINALLMLMDGIMMTLTIMGLFAFPS